MVEYCTAHSVPDTHTYTHSDVGLEEGESSPLCYATNSDVAAVALFDKSQWSSGNIRDCDVRVPQTTITQISLFAVCLSQRHCNIHTALGTAAYFAALCRLIQSSTGKMSTSFQAE